MKAKGSHALLLLLRACSVIFLSLCIIAATFAISVGPILRIGCHKWLLDSLRLDQKLFVIPTT